MSAKSSGSAAVPAVSFSEFVSYIGRELGIEMPPPTGDIVIGVDLELDSVTMLETVVAIEDLGVRLPADIFLTARSLREVYSSYLLVAGANSGRAAASPPRP